MTILNYAVLRYPPPIGCSNPEIEILGTLPLIGLLSATLALYTIVIGYLTVKTVSSNIKL